MAPLLKHNSELLFITPWGKRSLSTESKDLRREMPPLGVLCWGCMRRVRNSAEPTSGPADTPRVPRYLGKQSNSSEGWLVLGAYGHGAINPPPSGSSMPEQWRLRKMAFCATAECWQAGGRAIQGPVLLSMHLQDHLKTQWFYRAKTNSVWEDNSTFPACQVIWLEKVISKEKNKAPAKTAGKQCLWRATETGSRDGRLHHASLCLPTGAKSSSVVRGETD